MNTESAKASILTSVFGRRIPAEVVLRSVAAAISLNKKVKVIIDNDVRVPVAVMTEDGQKAILLPEEIMLFGIDALTHVRATLDHEVGHIRFSPLNRLPAFRHDGRVEETSFRKYYGEVVRKWVDAGPKLDINYAARIFADNYLNIFEDARIERLMIENYPASQVYHEASTSAIKRYILAGLRDKAEKGENVRENESMLASLYLLHRATMDGHAGTNDGSFMKEAYLDLGLGHIVDIVDEFVYQSPSVQEMKDFQQVVSLSIKFIEYLEKHGIDPWGKPDEDLLPSSAGMPGGEGGDEANENENNEPKEGDQEFHGKNPEEEGAQGEGEEEKEKSGGGSGKGEEKESGAQGGGKEGAQGEGEEEKEKSGGGSGKGEEKESGAQGGSKEGAQDGGGEEKERKSNDQGGEFGLEKDSGNKQSSQSSNGSEGESSKNKEGEANGRGGRTAGELISETKASMFSGGAGSDHLLTGKPPKQRRKVARGTEIRTLREYLENLEPDLPDYMIAYRDLDDNRRVLNPGNDRETERALTRAEQYAKELSNVFRPYIDEGVGEAGRIFVGAFRKRLKPSRRGHRIKPNMIHQVSAALKGEVPAASVEQHPLFLHRGGNKLDPRGVAVALLLDCSGSMFHDSGRAPSGKELRRIDVAAMAAQLLHNTFRSVGVSHGVFGFSTVDSWKGEGNRWYTYTSAVYSKSARSIPALNLVFKSFEEDSAVPVAHRITSFSFLHTRVRAVNGGECVVSMSGNCDADALLWCVEHLLARKEQRKIIIVISDGQPISYRATGSHLPRNFTDDIRITKDAVRVIREMGIEVGGIGLDNKSAQTIYDPHAALLKASGISITPAVLAGTIIELVSKMAESRG